MNDGPMPAARPPGPHVRRDYAGTVADLLAKPLADQVQSILIGQCGHYLAEEQPELVTAALLGFLRPLEGSS